MIRQKAYKYRFYPTDEQAAQLARTFGCARMVYNHFLQVRTAAWQQEQKSLNYHATAAMLTELKKQPEKAFLAEVSSVVLQQSLRNLDVAFTNFFAKRAKYPQFKKRKHAQSVRYATSAFSLRDGQLTLAKHAVPLNIVWSRPLPEDAKPVNVTVSRDTANRYFVSILVETEIKPLKRAKRTVGIDVGLTDLATTSDGEKLPNPRWLQKKQRQLKRTQRKLSRKVKGSANRSKARLRVAQIHAQIADARKDYIHKFTTKLIRENQAVFVEGLNVAGMLKNHSLAQSISNAAWSELFSQLKYKAEWYGREYVELDRFFPSSKLCSACGHLLVKLPLSVREWDCPNCQASHDRDTNAALNLKLAGEYLLATGSDARKVTPTKDERRRSG